MRHRLLDEMRLMGDSIIWRQFMSEQIKATELKQSRASKIQIEVKNVAQPIKNTTLQLSADADGGDISNE